MDKNILLLKYQDNFADNFSNYAYGSILEAKFKLHCYYENTTSKRIEFENIMKNFNLDCSYISSSRAENISTKSCCLDYKDINTKKIKDDKILNFDYFRIDDIQYLNNDIRTKFDFTNTDFIVNYDILEEIKSKNSIGLYINALDEPDYNYINESLKRLYKYLKKPEFYLFTKHKLKNEFYIPAQILNLNDWREEFYFLKNCKHKIIHCSKCSYSEGFWASILNQKSYNYIVFNKNIKCSKKADNWISI